MVKNAIQFCDICHFFMKIIKITFAAIKSILTMKPFKTLGSLVLFSSTLMLATSCSKSLDDQMPKGEQEVGQFATNCAPFLGIQTKQNSPIGTYVFLGGFVNPVESQSFYEADFTANNLIQFSATGGTPFYDPQYIRIGVTDQWISGTETLTLKLQNGWAAKRMQMQFRTQDVVATATFYLAGEMVGSAPLVGGPGEISGMGVYEATGSNKEFDEVKFSVTSGKLALSGFTPNLIGGGLSGFFLAEIPGDRVALRLDNGVTNIGGTDYPNQYFTMTTNFEDGPDAMRQNRNPLPSMTPGSGEFTDGGSPVIPGSSTYVNISGTAPLVYRNDATPNNFRFGVGDQFINSGETITITPGADFPSSYFRMIEFRSATLMLSKIKISAYRNGTLVRSGESDGTDKSFTLLTSQIEFDEVRITWVSGPDASIGRYTPGPVGGAILLYPGCP